MHEGIRNGLTTKQRGALLAELQGMPQDEIARHLGSNRNALYKLGTMPQAPEAGSGGGRVHGRGHRRRVRRMRKQTMSLSNEEIAELLRLIGLTRDEEIDYERAWRWWPSSPSGSSPAGRSRPGWRPSRSPVDARMLRGIQGSFRR